MQEAYAIDNSSLCLSSVSLVLREDDRKTEHSAEDLQRTASWSRGQSLACATSRDPCWAPESPACSATVQNCTHQHEESQTPILQKRNLPRRPKKWVPDWVMKRIVASLCNWASRNLFEGNSKKKKSKDQGISSRMDGIPALLFPGWTMLSKMVTFFAFPC